MHTQPALLVDTTLEVFAVLGSTDAMLRCEQPNEIHSGVTRARTPQQINVGYASGIDAGLVGQQRDSLAADQADAVLEQNRDARTHARRRTTSATTDGR